MNIASLALIILGSSWAIYFESKNERTLLAIDLSIAISGVSIALLARRGDLRKASLLLIIVIYALLSLIGLLFDIPTKAAPRSMHFFFLILAVASCLLFRYERAWIRHGLTSACFAAFIFLASSNEPLIAGYALPDSVRVGGTWVNNMCCCSILFLIIQAFIGDVDRMESYLHEANNRFVGLVQGMFPKSIAERLLTSGRSFAERHQNCSVLFADIVSFTNLTEQMEPDILVDMLSAIFSRFDGLVNARNLTKIKTIGDAYMVAAGVPEPRLGHAIDLVELGREMLLVSNEFKGIQLRIGIASGELVAGVIGNSRQVYDVWGDAVNMASRMESHGMPGRIQVSESTHRLASKQFSFDCRKGIAIKGKGGLHDVYILST